MRHEDIQIGRCYRLLKSALRVNVAKSFIGTTVKVYAKGVHDGNHRQVYFHPSKSDSGSWFCYARDLVEVSRERITYTQLEFKFDAV